MSNNGSTPSFEELNGLSPQAQQWIHQLQAENQDMQEQINAQVQHGRDAHMIKPPKLQDPQTYDGARNTRLIDDYLYDVKQHIRNDPLKFHREETKIRFAASFLKGLARTWFRTLDETNPPWTTYEEYTKELKDNFAELDPEEYWRRRWANLQQRSSITQYLSDFKTIEAHLNLTEEDKYHQFKKGLRSNVLDQLALQPRPATLDELIKLANQVDMHIYEHSKNKSEDTRNSNRKPSGYGNNNSTFQRRPFNNTYQTNRQPGNGFQQRTFNKASYPNNQPTTSHKWPSSTPVEDRMQLDTIKRGPLSPQEKDYRQRNNLCMYCGKPGHSAINCPLNRNKSFQPKPNSKN